MKDDFKIILNILHQQRDVQRLKKEKEYRVEFSRTKKHRYLVLS